MRATSAGVARTLTALVSFVTSAYALDYLIVGGGTAGLVLANRLTEDASVSVMVLEAGGDGLGNTNISAIAPLGLAWGTDIDWSFPIEPLQFANNRAVPNAPRGKVLGGSSSINGDVFDRGDSIEYDEWEILGNAGWNSKSILAAAFKGEKFTPPNATWNIEYDVHDHGLQGPLDTSFNAPAPSFHDVIIDSVVNAGGIKATDVAGGKVDGISHVTNSRTPSNATRSTSATGYYFPYSYRSNMQVTLFVTVTKVIWASTTPGQVIAAGVEYIDSNGTTHTLNATNVILAGGVWGSPPILERSGVGNATFLASLGIDTVIDLPGVGENMQEQTLLQMSYELNVSIPDVDLSPILINFESLQKTVGENRTELEALLDIQPPNLSNALYDATKRLYQANAPWVEHFALIATSGTNNTILTIFPVNLRPLSRGSCHIVSTNGTEYPIIKWNWFEAEFDTYVMATAAKRVQDIVNTPPLSDWISAPIIPANLTATVNDFGYITLANAQQADHPLGTALMAPREDGGVVDANLKVYGTTNLYVIDASVIPLLPAAHLQGTVYALAERAADLLRQ